MNVFDPALVVVQALGWCLFHFLWQGMLVGTLYAVARGLLPRGNPRYLAAMAAMVLLAACPMITGWYELEVLAQPADLGNMVVAGPAGTMPFAAASGRPQWFAGMGAALPWLVLAWGCGVTLLVLRVVRQWHGLRAIVRASEALPAWQERARRLGACLGLRRAARILGSARIATPTLVGWVRPVVVVPLAMLARMPTEQVDLILAHELAHLRRLDHLANLFQIVVETLLFYHPVVHWISRDARNERELCCDALVLRAMGGRRRDYVAALAGLADLRSGTEVALAASGGVLVERAWFIAGAMPRRRHGRANLTIGLALLGVAIAVGVAWRQDIVRQRVEHVLSANHAQLLQHMGGLVADFAAPPLRELPETRPDLAPIALPPARAEGRVPGTAPLRGLVASVSPPSLAVEDVASVRLLPVPAVQRSTPTIGDTVHSSAVAAPRAIRTAEPTYPSQALRHGVQGQVEVQFTLGADGVPRDLQVVDSSASDQLDAAALDALSRWRFAPPAVAGRPYRQWFTFRLGGDAAESAGDLDCLPSTGTHICRHALDADPGIRVVRPNR